MPDLNDLKQNAKRTTGATKTSSSKKQQKPTPTKKEQNLQGFIPGIEPDEIPVQQLNPQNRIVLGSNTGRKQADFSSLPTPAPAGVDIKKSPADEIMKPGGVFDQYIKNKIDEFDKDMEEQSFNQRIDAQNTDGDNMFDLTSSDVTVDEDEKELEEIYGNTTVNFVSRGNIIHAQPIETEQEEEEDDMPLKHDLFKDRYDEIEEDESVAEEDMGYDDEPEDAYENEQSEGEYFEDEEEEEEESMQKSPAARFVEVEENHDDIDEGEVILTEEEKRKVGRNEPVASVLIVNDEEQDDVLEKMINSPDTAEEEENARLEELKSLITEKVRPISTKRNIQGFSVAKKGTTSNKILNNVKKSTAKWVLPVTGTCFEIMEVSGSEIEYIRENLGSEISQVRNRLRMIYDKIVSPKAPTFEGWCKSIAYQDYDHLFMAIYIAGFADANYVPYTCYEHVTDGKKVGCRNVFLSNNIPIMDMIKFTDEESKNKFYKLYESGRFNSKGLYASDIIPISNDFAIGLKTPSIYDILFEAGLYNTDFREKYSRTIGFIPYIDAIYYIDGEKMQLVPVEYKVIDNNMVKTAKSKVIRYTTIIDSLTTDEFSMLYALVNAIDTKANWFQYRIPEVSCPKCRASVPEEITTAENMVFTRHRLGVLASTSIK